MGQCNGRDLSSDIKPCSLATDVIGSRMTCPGCCLMDLPLVLQLLYPKMTCSDCSAMDLPLYLR